MDTSHGTTPPRAPLGLAIRGATQTGACLCTARTAHQRDRLLRNTYSCRPRRRTGDTQWEKQTQSHLHGLTSSAGLIT